MAPRAIFTPQKASLSLESSVISRDTKSGVLRAPWGLAAIGSDLELRLSLLYNQCMFLADVSRAVLALYKGWRRSRDRPRVPRGALSPPRGQETGGPSCRVQRLCSPANCEWLHVCPDSSALGQRSAHPTRHPKKEAGRKGWHRTGSGWGWWEGCGHPDGSRRGRAGRWTCSGRGARPLRLPGGAPSHCAAPVCPGPAGP